MSSPRPLSGVSVRVTGTRMTRSIFRSRARRIVGCVARRALPDQCAGRSPPTLFFAHLAGDGTLHNKSPVNRVNGGAIPGSLRIPLAELSQRHAQVPAGPVIIHCASAAGSLVFASVLAGRFVLPQFRLPDGLIGAGLTVSKHPLEEAIPTSLIEPDATCMSTTFWPTSQQVSSASAHPA